ncbi:Gaa1-domain-containing protein [Exidia glandulosa HHB12029]|uniref:Gaa1-domain-containing protein n=1 Tax=Exidia glandulosa HHB12029 TaxID=1314781 RepID=A0A165MHQ8_EXIGL|nr:Gaa1-domain-containing protein [Exidia glandulosa HHB12029]
MAGLIFRLIAKAWRRRRAGADDDGDEDPHAALVARVRRRRQLENLYAKYLVYARILLLVLGYAWLAALASPWLGRGTYIDENALQPGQVLTKWGWDDVHAADRYLESLDALHARNASKAELTAWVKDEFAKLGISSSTQRYAFSTATGSVNGTNTYAVFPAPRSSGAEAMVISASWLSRIDEGAGAINQRGVPTVLALARFLTNYSYWAKDLVFVISDGYLDGMQAWLNAYHGLPQSNLVAEPLELSSGVIWTALNIDYPGHSFSHLGLFFDGLNGRLPNQDLMNSVAMITSHTGGVPVVLYDHIEQPFSLSRHHGKADWHVKVLKELHTYQLRARNILRHFGYEVVGRPSGVHGLFHQFRIDAITVFAVPAVGPHGFHSLGKLVESSLRTMNNLLERLHASFFLYLMAGPHAFLKIGHYLPCAIILSIAITLTGLGVWRQAGWTEYDEWDAEVEYKAALEQTTKESPAPVLVTEKTFVPRKRQRAVMEPLGVMLATHAIGVLLLFAMRFPSFYNTITIAASYIGLVLVAPPPLKNGLRSTGGRAPFHTVLHAFTLLSAGMVISIIAVLNFALAASLAAVLALPFVSVSPQSHRLFKIGLAALCAPAFVNPGFAKNVVREYELLGGWFLPFVCVVYVPIVLQSWMAAVLYI